MRADHLAGWNAGLVGATGICLALYPTLSLGLVRIADPSFPVLALARTLGAVCLVLAVILWTARHWLGSSAGAQARRSMAIAYGVGGLLLLAQQIAIWNNRAGLLAVAAFAGWAISFARARNATTDCVA